MGAMVIMLMVMMEVVTERASWVLGPHMSLGRVRAQPPEHLLLPAFLGTTVWPVTPSHGSRRLALLRLSVASQGTGLAGLGQED